MLPLLIWIVSQIFRPLQVISFKRRSCFRCFGDALVFIRTGSTEEPGSLLRPVRDSASAASFPPGWAETLLLPFLKFPGCIVVLTACVVLLPQLSSSFWLLQKKMFCKTISKILLPRAKSCPWFSFEQLVVSVWAWGWHLCLLNDAIKELNCIWRKAAFTFTWC